MTIRIGGRNERRRTVSQGRTGGQGVAIGGNGVSAPSPKRRAPARNSSKGGFRPLQGNETVVSQQGHVRIVAKGRPRRAKVTQVDGGPAQNPQVVDARARARRPALTLTAGPTHAVDASQVPPGALPAAAPPTGVPADAVPVEASQTASGEGLKELPSGAYYSDRLGRYVLPNEPEYDVGTAIRMGVLNPKSEPPPPAP